MAIIMDIFLCNAFKKQKQKTKPMKTQRLTKVILVLALAILVIGKASAQFNDFHNYPYTTTPSEKKDSTRGHVWGYTFGSVYDKVHADSINKPGPGGVATSPKTGTTQYSGVPENFTALSFQRIYLGYDYFFNNTFSAHIVLAHEEFYDGGTTATTKDDIEGVSVGGAAVGGDLNRTLYIKYCNFEWDNIFKGSNLTVGATTTPGFPVTEEPLWGYRSLERTIMDMRGIVSSNDVGINLGGHLWSQKDASGKENACIGYNIMAANGTNAVPDNDGILSTDFSNFHRYYGDVYARVMGDKLIFDLYSDYHVVVPGQNDFVWRGLVGYKDKNWNLSAEYFDESLSNQATYTTTGSSTVETTGISHNGFSVEGALTLMRDKNTNAPKFGLVARYDMYNPNSNYNANDDYITGGGSNAYTENFMLFALDYQPIKQIHIMPNIWYDGFSDRANKVTDLAKSDNDVVLRITFYFLFYKN
jgi:hypothetical protein